MMKSVLLVSVAALSLVGCSAMAQEGGDAYPVHQASPKAEPVKAASHVQSGTSDPEPAALNWQRLPSYSDQSVQ